MGVILLYLFQKPLRQLLSNTHAGNANRRVTDLMIKYSILSWITIMMSMVSLLVYLWNHITLGIELNVPVSVICVMLLHTKYDGVYRKCCRPCIRLCHVRCRNRKDEKKVAQMIQIGSETPVSPDSPRDITLTTSSGSKKEPVSEDSEH